MKKVLAVLIALILFGGPKDSAHATELICELGQRMSIAGDQSIDNVIHLIWRGQGYNLQRIGTSSGAHRFEHSDSGLLWIGIPAKGMLLDTKRGTPLANECRTAEQQRSRR